MRGFEPNVHQRKVLRSQQVYSQTLMTKMITVENLTVAFSFLRWGHQQCHKCRNNSAISLLVGCWMWSNDSHAQSLITNVLYIFSFISRWINFSYVKEWKKRDFLPLVHQYDLGEHNAALLIGSLTGV